MSSPPPLTDQPAMAASAAHREFFETRGDSRQVWAKEVSTGRIIHLPEREADAFRAACDAGEFICPIPGCRSPAFRARGAEVLRHHFAHRHAAVGHRRPEIWRVEALAALRDWITRGWSALHIEELDHSLLLTSPRSRRRVHLEVAARRLAAETWRAVEATRSRDGVAYQLILAPTPGVVRPLDDLGGGAYAVRLRGLASAIVSQKRAVVLLNPEHRLVGTLTSTALARAAGLAAGSSTGVLFVEALDDAKLCESGILTPAAAKVLAVPDPRRSRPARRRRPSSWTPPAVRRPPPRPAEQLPAVAPDAVADEGMDDASRLAIFKHQMRRYRAIAPRL